LGVNTNKKFNVVQQLKVYINKYSTKNIITQVFFQAKIANLFTIFLWTKTANPL